MLHILKTVLPFLPLDGRTLKKTMRVVSTKEVKPGHYYHFGIQDGIKKNIVNLNTVASNDIGIIMNVDGIPLTKSTNHQFCVCRPVARFTRWEGLEHRYICQRGQRLGDFRCSNIRTEFQLSSRRIYLRCPCTCKNQVHRASQFVQRLHEMYY
jgi:hypothetical protein